jgi:hypothetical protein
MNDHKSVVEAVRKATDAKARYSESPRKGERVFLAIKLESTPERVSALESMLKSEGNEIFEGWYMFYSKDRSTTGLYKITSK